MKKRNLFASLAISSMLTLSSIVPTLAAEQSTYVAFGGGLNQSQIEQVRDEFGISANDAYETTVTGDDVARYLGINSYSTSILISNVMVKRIREMGLKSIF